jgi:hypothetical protein
VINLNAVANEVFQILRSYDYTVMMYDDDGMEVYEPDDARRMFAKPENLLVSIVEDNDNSSIKLYRSGDTDVESVLGLVDSLRTVSDKYNLIFNHQQWDRDLSVKDFANGEPTAPRRRSADRKWSRQQQTRRRSTDRKIAVGETQMDLTEGMFGTSRSSYLKLENARMIVRHSAKIDENVAGARSRKIDNIFVENQQGERFLFPTKQLAPARAMTQHFNHGGSFADEVGQQITQMATDYSALGQASSFIGMNQPMLGEAAGELRQKCRESRKDMRKCFERLYRESTYSSQADILREQAANPVLVEDAALAHLREMLTVEGKELDENVIATVARCVEAAQPVLDEADEPEVSGESPEETRPAPVSRKRGPTVMILGREVDEDAWTAFKQGTLELRANPESLAGAGPEFTSKQAEIAHKVGAMSALVMNDSMSNLLSWASEEMGNAQGKLLRDLITLGSHALIAAKVKITEGFGFRGLKAIREFEEWLDDMTAEKVLAPTAEVSPPSPMDTMDAPMGAPMDAPMGAMDAPMGAMDAPMDAPMGAMDAPEPETIGNEGMAADIVQGYSEGSNWRLVMDDAEMAAAVCGGEEAILIAISNAVLGGARNGSVHSDPDNGPRQSFPWCIEDTITVSEVPAPQPSPVMTPPVNTSPVQMDPMSGLGESELTREDILLPKDNKALDLKQEVGHDVQSRDAFIQGEDGEEEDASKDLTIERMRKLSGIRID